MRTETEGRSVECANLLILLCVGGVNRHKHLHNIRLTSERGHENRSKPKERADRPPSWEAQALRMDLPEPLVYFAGMALKKV